MAKLKSPKALEAFDQVMSWAEEFGFDDSFRVSLDNLIRRVQDDEQEAHLKGRVEFMGKPYMLYRLLEDIVGNERRPVWRESKIMQIRRALDEYLGLDFETSQQKPRKKRKKRKRRRLLTRD